jgi:D-3-phosphoglycerate dehydrogenase
MNENDSQSKRATVLLTNPMYPKWQDYLSDRFRVLMPEDSGPSGLMDIAHQANYIIVRSPLPPELFERANRLKAVIRHGAGLDMIPMSAADKFKIAVANAPGANARTVAEYVIGQLINLSRHLVQVHNALNQYDWPTARALSSNATELNGKCLVIVGVGAIGSVIAKICSIGFNMRVIGVTQTSTRYSDFIEYKSLGEALGQADYLVLSCPLNGKTQGLIDHKALQLMKRGAKLINVSRGAVIDEQALIFALKEGQLGGAALDVFHVQPLPETSPLRNMKQVILSPHLAGITDESMEAMSEMVVRQIETMEDGQLPQHLVNKEHSEAIRQRWQMIDTSADVTES